MNLFLDTSVLLAACGSAKGASRNLVKLPAAATADWVRLRQQLKIVDDVVSLDRPVVFLAGKDRPILFTALAWSDALITLDRDDFAKFLGGEFYGLRVRLPFNFLEEERAEGRLKISRP